MVIRAIILSTIVLTSCQLNFESTFHEDQTTSMMISMKMDEEVLDKMKQFEQHQTEEKIFGKDVEELPVEWTSFYDMIKSAGDSLPEDKDSIRLLKLMNIRFDVDGEKYNGFAMRIERANKEDLKHFSTIFQKMNSGNQMNKNNSSKINSPVVNWDGRTLIIPTGGNILKDQNNNETTPNPMESLDFVKEMFGDAKFTITYTYRFENKIKKIKGKHDLVSKINNKTIEYKVDVFKMMEMEAKGEKPAQMDDKIVVTTQ